MKITDNPYFPNYIFFLDMLEAKGITDMDGAIHLLSEIGHRGVSSIRGIGERSTSDFFNKWLKAVSYYIKTKEKDASIEERLQRLEGLIL